MKRGTMYTWPSVTWSEISTLTTDQHMPKHSDAGRISSSCVLDCWWQICKSENVESACVQLLFFWKDTLYYLQSISNAIKFTSGRYNLGIQVSCENFLFCIRVKKTTYCNDQIKSKTMRESHSFHKKYQLLYMYFSYCM